MASTLSRGGAEQTSELENRILALESELSDTKRQLHEMTISKGKIELEKRELEALLLEAHTVL